jgi:predicted membrane protein
LPWSGCIAATDWQIHLNRDVVTDISAHSGGGNVRLDLAGMHLRRVSADSGGGNLDVMLPDNAVSLSVTAKTGVGNITVEIGRGTTGHNILNAISGAGNVEVRIPSGIAARIHATSGMGKKIIDPRFGNIDKHDYQSSDFDRAVDKVEIDLQSGAGNVIVNTR